MRTLNTLVHNRKITSCDLAKVTEKKLKKNSKLKNQTALPSQTSAFCEKAVVKHASGKPLTRARGRKVVSPAQEAAAHHCRHSKSPLFSQKF